MGIERVDEARQRGLWFPRGDEHHAAFSFPHNNMNITLKDLPQEGIPATIPINASGLKISACPRRWFLTVFLGLKPKEDITALTVGKIIHKFAENIAFDRGGENWQAACLEAFTEAKAKGLPAKEQDQIRKALTAAPLTQLPIPLKFGDNKGAEFHFNFPIVEHPAFAYVGTVDLLSLAPSGILQITDYKTTRKYAFKDAVAGYEGDTQFSFYYYIFQRFAYEIFKDDINLGNAAWYRRMIIRTLIVQISLPAPAWRTGPDWSFSGDQLDEFGRELKARIELFSKLINEALAHDKLPPPSGKLVNACPSCPFKRLCFADNSTQIELFLSECDVVKYEPLSW